MQPSFKATVSIEGMSCASCAARVDKALAALDGVYSASVNLANETALLELEHAAVLGDVTQILVDLGYPARSSEAVFSVGNMSCASCAGRVQKAFEAVTGVTGAEVNLASESAKATFLQGLTDPATLAAHVTAAGYPTEIAKAQDTQNRSARKEDEARQLRRQVLLAAILVIPVFIMEMGGHLVPAFHHWIARTIGQQNSWLIQFALTTAALLGPGRMFYRKGFPALLKGAPDMNSLVAVGTGAAYIYSVVATFVPSLLPAGVRVVYFEAAGVIVLLILLGRWFEARAKGQTGAAIEALLGLQVKTARRVDGDDITDVPIEALQVGDIIDIPPGARIAVDGTVLSGDGHVDESMITGEPVPAVKTAGDAVTGGTVNGAGALRIRASRVGADTTLSQIIRMVQDAQGARLPIQGLVDRITLWFVPAVMAIAALTVLVWLILGPNPALTFALVAGVSVLIIACPCAMGLATPTSIMVGTGRAAELGVLFRKGDALQLLSSVDVVAFDKTGTITAGRPELTDLVLASGQTRAQVLALVAGAEQSSEHPIAQAIVRAAKDEGVEKLTASGFETFTGFGVKSRVGGCDVLVGADRLMTREGVDITPLQKAELSLAEQGHTALYAAVDGQIAAVIGVSDPIKPSSAAAIAALRDKGLKVAMITGDRPETAQVIAREAGIDHVIAGILPDGKVAAIKDLGADSQRVAFVGDGINDAPALAQADVGIAIGTGTDIAIEAADVVLMSGDLRGVETAYDVSVRTLRNIRQNLFWAFGYNIALIPVAAGVLYPAFGILLSPALAAGAMAFSSVFVLGNALRLRRMGQKLSPDAPMQAPDAAPTPAE